MQSSEMLLLPNQILARPTTETTTVKNVKQLEYYADWSWAGGRLERQREEKRVRCNSGWEQSIKKSWSEAVKRALLFCRLCKVLLLLISELAAVSIFMAIINDRELRWQKRQLMRNLSATRTSSTTSVWNVPIAHLHLHNSHHHHTMPYIVECSRDSRWCLRNFSFLESHEKWVSFKNMLAGERKSFFFFLDLDRERAVDDVGRDSIRFTF